MRIAALATFFFAASACVSTREAEIPDEVVEIVARLNTDSPWVFESTDDGSYFGYSVSEAGDVNGDGYGDVIIGAPFYSNDKTAEGAAWVFHGSETGLVSSTPDWGVEGDQNSAIYGYSVSYAGDVDGDGFGDVIVGAPFFDNGTQSDVGKVFVYLGSDSGLSSSPAWTKEGDEADSKLGFSVSSAGDMNGDGFADVVFGAPQWQNCQGKVFVYAGAESSPLSYDLLSNPGEPSSSFGRSVALAGDVNGDGFSDVIVGSPSYSNGNSEHEGRARIFLGGSSVTEPVWNPGPHQASSSFGESVSAAGDVNGDGYGDVVVGAPYFSNGEDKEGGAFLYFGSNGGLLDSHDRMVESDEAIAYFGESVSTAGDLNGDGFADIVVGARRYGNGGSAFVYYGFDGSIDATQSETLGADETGTLFGGAVSSAGDVNGDGFADLIVGAEGWGNDNEGAAYVYLGQADVPSPTEDWFVEGDEEEAWLGSAVSIAGDVNGDGFNDVIIGAELKGNGGAAQVFHGSLTGPVLSPSWEGSCDASNARYGASVAGAGDINGDGYGDIVVGARYFD
ncbi:MAG: hypothetical protein HN348_26850, partial [Proteobacteria bacterium]|nr:hypothetical protein [Pseudomonadota bacterium]